VSDSSDEADAIDRVKRELRHDLLTRRRALPAPTRADAAGAVHHELAALVRRLRPATMTGYAPVGGEPGGPELPEVLLRAVGAVAGRLLLPVLRADLDLDWGRYTGPDCLVAAGRGMREPAGARLGRSAIGGAGLVVVPALAVDRAGIRLGRGGGSYDRALARVAPDALIVALLHDGELVDGLPARPHDRPVHAVVTPTGGFRQLVRRGTGSPG
jgi:5-formyltetrahydrofolate cyclo-ligase